MPKVTFFLRSNNDGANTRVLYCRVSHHGLTGEFSTGEKIDPKFWNQAAQMYLPARSKREAEFINSLTESLRFRLKENAIRVPEANTPKKLIKSLTDSGKAKCVLLETLVKDYIDSVLHEVRPGTLKNHRIKLKNLLAYQEATGRKFAVGESLGDLHAFDVSEAQRFIAWFKISKETKNQSTASKNVELYRKSLQYALKTGKIKNHDLALYTGNRDKVKPAVFLTKSEIALLAGHSFASTLLDKVRDLYCLQIYTGLSFSDIWNRWEIVETDNGPAVRGKRTKNEHAFFLPVDPEAMKILEKYNFRLPRMENQVFNRVLKEIAAIVGIEKRLTSHVGRKTFATRMDEKGWSVESIAKMLGHRSIRTTETYYIGESFRRVENEWRAKLKS